MKTAMKVAAVAPVAKGAMKSQKATAAKNDFNPDPKPKKTPPPPTGTDPSRHRGVCKIYPKPGLIRGVIGRLFDKRVSFGKGTGMPKQDAWIEVIEWLDTKLAQR